MPQHIRQWPTRSGSVEKRIGRRRGLLLLVLPVMWGWAFCYATTHSAIHGDPQWLITGSLIAVLSLPFAWLGLVDDDEEDDDDDEEE